MTALDTPVLPGTAERDRPSDRRAPTPPRIRPPGERPAKSFTSDLLASSGLALFSLAVAAGFARVFPGWGFFDAFAVIAIVGHGSGLVARRFRVPAWATIPIVMVVVFWTVGYIYYGATYSWGLPTSDTWTLFNAELDLVREQFSVAVAPVVDSGGWDVLAAIGLAIAVVLADAFAFGALARAEALVPGGVLFVFIAALGSDRQRVALSALLVGAGVVATVLLRAHHAPGGITDATRGAPRVLTQAAGVALAVALIAGYVGERIPGATSEPLLETRGVGDDDSSALSPLVDIRSRLTNQRNVEMIFVQASAKSYWRATTLADFDGQVWQAPDHEIGAPDPNTLVARPPDATNRQQVSIRGLGGTQVPAAPDPFEADGPSLRFDAASATLSTAAEELERNDSYVVSSAPPGFDPTVLAAATSFAPPDGIYLELPDDFPADAAALAAEVTAGAQNNYEAAKLLQDWFRTEFEYSLQVQPGHGNNAIEGFLRDRVGYCEQFAGTYAAMMRSLRIPARVAVGFTYGKATGTGYSVTGRNAHAWPEVWFDGLGWVLFEPTPGRGAPGAEGYTGLDEDQDTSTGSEGDGQGEEPVPEEPAPAEPPTGPTTLPPIPEEDAAPATPIPAEPVEPESSDSGEERVLLALLGAAALAVAAPPIGRRIRRRSTRSPSEQVANNWERAVDALRLVDVPIVNSATPAETALVAVRTFPIVSRPMRSLADTITLATYAEPGTVDLDHVGTYGASTVRDTSHWARQIERAVNDSVSKRLRVYRYFTRWR
ncbi:MAG: DUF3488 and transglutaminase-like domain-containing protein [Ilumatobacteraceae bacterium]